MPPTYSAMDAHSPALKPGNSGHGLIKNAGDATVKAMSLDVAETPTLDAAQFKTEWSESFDTSFGRLSRTWGDVKIDTSQGAAVLTSSADTNWAAAGMMVPPTDASAGDGYGLYTITARTSFQAGPGPFAALWPGSDKWPGPERDIFEKASQGDTDGYSTVHWADASGNDRYAVYRYPAGTIKMSEVHTYQMDWAADHLSLYIDKTLIYSTNANLSADFAHGGQDAAFGAGMQPAWAAAQQTGTTNVLTIYDMSYSSPVPPSMSIGAATIGEGGVLTFTVSLAKASADPVLVTYHTVDGTATSADYTAGSGTLTFDAGVTSQTISVQITQDSLIEGSEDLTLHLDAATGATIANADGVGTITDDDVPGLTVGNASVLEGGKLSFTVTLDATSPVPVTVGYATVSGTASSTDYSNATGTLTFGAGETSKTIDVVTTGDTVVEPDETLTLHLSDPMGATIVTADGRGTILNDDVVPPSLKVADASVTEGATLGFAVSLSAASTSPVTVRYATANGTALASSDYTAKSGTITFNPGDITKTIDVLTTPDSTVEANETMVLRLSSANGATIADGEGIGSILNDDAPTPSLKVSDASVAEGGLLNFTVSLSAAGSSPVKVNYATANYTASAPSDYVAKATTTLTFAAGETSKVISVQTVQDPTVEASEAMLLRLTSPSGATLADSSGTGTITNNDVLGKSFNGTTAANTLTGTQYNDVITGGRGNDTMSGLNGEDRFVFSRYDGFDRIKDFTPGMDDLVLKGIAASAVTAKAAIYSGVSGTDVSYGGTDHVFLEGVTATKFVVGIDVVFA